MAASLVKYDNPVLVSSAGDGKRAKANTGSSTAAVSGTSATQDILNSILPPRYVFHLIASLESVHFNSATICSYFTFSDIS